MRVSTFLLLFLLISDQSGLCQVRFYEGTVSNCVPDTSTADAYYPSTPLIYDDISKIELVSFEGSWLTYGGDWFSPRYGSKIKVVDSSVVHEKIDSFQIDLLSIDSTKLLGKDVIDRNEEIERVLAVFTDHYTGEKVRFSGGALCYIPRNGVVFYGEKGEILLVYELCFECSNYAVIWRGERFSVLCMESLGEAFELFDQRGFEHGIQKR